MIDLNNEEYRQQFLEHLETVILSTRGGGSGAIACSEVLLSLYNGNDYRANLSKLYNLDSKNKDALLFVIKYHTDNHSKAIDLYLPQYAQDFDRMRQEYKERY